MNERNNMENENQPNQQPTNPVPPSNPPVPSPTPPVTNPVTNPGLGNNAHTENKVFAALSYISVLFVIPLVVKGDDEFIKYHAKQGMVLFGAELIIWFVLFLLESLLTAISPLTGFGLLTWLGGLFWIVFLVISLMGVYYAWMGKRWKMFLLGGIAAKIKI